jgi:hypothetical protein
MIDRRLWLLIGACCLCFASRVAATPVVQGAPPRPPPDRPRSHRSINPDLDPFTAEDQLNERLQQAAAVGKVHELQNLFKNKELLKQLTKGKLTDEQLHFLDGNSDKIAALLRDARFRDFLKDSLAAKKGGEALNDQQIDTLKWLAEGHFDPASLPTDSGASDRRQDQTSENEERTRKDSSDLKHDRYLNEPDGPAEEKPSWFDEQMTRVVNSVMAEMNNPANAGAFEDALRSLGGIKDDADGSQNFDFAGLWQSTSNDVASWMTSRWYWPHVLVDAPRELYRDLREALPEIGGTVGGALARVPAGQTPSASTRVPIEAIAWSVFAVCLAAIVWQSIGRKVAARVRSDQWKLGPWPVQPGAVANRDDLVRAFEYLALLRLGAVARTSNHLAVAARLGAVDPDDQRRAAAAELARLYERARYEPEPVSLDDSQLEAARRDLTLLARPFAA